MINDKINLKYGKWSAEICPRLGGNVISLKYGDENVLRPLVNEDELKINPYLYGAPILMPANRTFEGKFIFEGRKYRLPINEPKNNCNLHGAVLYQAFEALKITDNSAILRFTDRDCISYPFPFEITVTYSVSDNGLSSVYEIKNVGSKNMPLTFCMHTTFTEPESFTCPIDLCQEKDLHHIPTGRYVELNEQEKKYAVFSPSRGLNISGYYHACGKSARIGDYTYTVSDNFDHWIFYNGNGESGYLCVEPQCGMVNGLNTQNGHRVVEPNEKITFETQISRI